MFYKLYTISLLTVTLLLQVIPAHANASEVKTSYLYNLSNSAGVIPFNWVTLSCDRQHNELYVVDTSDGTVRIFNDNGMEVFSCGGDEGLGSIYDIAVKDDGDLLLLSYIGGKYSLILSNFRGEPKSRMEVKGLPKGFPKDFYPNSIACWNGSIYLTDKGSMMVLVTDKNGLYQRHFDLGELVGLDEKKKSDNGIVGFSLDKDGSMLFTVPTLFSAFVVTTDKKVKAFGTRGSSHGKFNIAGGIASDDNGNYYVVDTLRAVVIVFDKDFKFRSEFGNWGFDPGNLVSPMNIAVDKDRVYVTQSRGRGVSVYRLLPD